jgi:hypothetical protein
MRPFAVLCFALLCLAAIAGCSKDEEIFRANPSKTDDPEELAIRADIAALANGAKPSDPECSVRYDKAVNELIMRGVKVETRLIDALRSNADPWIRVGCVEVLTAVATKVSIEHLVAVLDDNAPLVAQRANIALQTLTGERQIPEAGQPAKGDLPPVPARAADDLAMDAEERIWATWHAAHKDALKAAWQRWWTANKPTFTLK